MAPVRFSFSASPWEPSRPTASPIAAVAPTFLLAVVGSLLTGPALGWLVFRLMERVEHVPTAIILQYRQHVWRMDARRSHWAIRRVDDGVLRRHGGTHCALSECRQRA